MKARPIGTRLWLAPADDEHVPHDRLAVQDQHGARIRHGRASDHGAVPRVARASLSRAARRCSTTAAAPASSRSRRSRSARASRSPSTTTRQALLATRANAALNGVTERLFVGAPEALPDDRPSTCSPPTSSRARSSSWRRRLRSASQPGGWLVLSGILEAQAARVAAAYAPYFERVRADRARRLGSPRGAPECGLTAARTARIAASRTKRPPCCSRAAPNATRRSVSPTRR